MLLLCYSCARLDNTVCNIVAVHFKPTFQLFMSAFYITMGADFKLILEVRSGVVVMLL